MRFPVAIEIGTSAHAFGVVVPDLPGCFSAGETLDEALNNAEEAAAAWIDSALDDGDPIPAPSPLDALRIAPEFAGWSFGVVSVADAVLDDQPSRVNVSLPRRVLARLDAQAKAAGKTRSGYIAEMTLRRGAEPT
jgi:predicted RNase H-like HicB family nuclease